MFGSPVALPVYWLHLFASIFFAIKGVDVSNYRKKRFGHESLYLLDRLKVGKTMDPRLCK
jgi:hypothetical protein